MSTEQPDMTAGEVARRLSVHIDTLRTYLRQGLFPNAYVLPGKRDWRIPASDVADFRARYRGAKAKGRTDTHQNKGDE